MSSTVIHADPSGRRLGYVVARKLPDGRYVAPVHAAFWNTVGHYMIGSIDDVFPVGYVYGSPSSARERARVLFPFAQT